MDVAYGHGCNLLPLKHCWGTVCPLKDNMTSAFLSFTVNIRGCKREDVASCCLLLLTHCYALMTNLLPSLSCFSFSATRKRRIEDLCAALGKNNGWVFFLEKKDSDVVFIYLYTWEERGRPLRSL